MSKSISFLFAVLLLFPTARSGCQHFPMIHYSIDDGLPSNTVYYAYRDSKGFLWIATDRGVARYNGIKFEVFTTSNGLPDNEVFFFKEDGYERLWLATGNGELCYFKEGIFHSAANTPLLRMPGKRSFINVIKTEDDGSVTIAFNRGSYFVNVGLQKASILNVPMPENPQIELTDIRKRADAVYTLDYTDRTILIDSQSRVIQVKIAPDSAKTTKNKYFQDSKYSYNDHSIAVNGRILKRIGKALYEKIISVYFDGANLFIGTSHGLLVGDTLTVLKTCKISSLTQDGEGNYWVTTLSDGLYYFGYNYSSSSQFPGAYSNVVEYSCIRKGRLFFATSVNNLYCLGNSSAKCLFDYRAYRSIHFEVPHRPGYYLDSNGRFFSYFNSDNFIVDHVLSAAKKVVHYKNNFLTDGIDFLFGRGNILYMELRKRFVLKLDYSKIRPEVEINDHLQRPVDMNNQRIAGMAVDADGNIWFSTSDSMYKITDDHAHAVSKFDGISFKSFLFFGKYLVGYTLHNQLLVCSNIIGPKLHCDSIPDQNCLWDKIYPLDSTHILISTNNLYRLLTVSAKGGVPVCHVRAVENSFAPLNAESICVDTSKCYFFKGGSITSLDKTELLAERNAPKVFFRFFKAGSWQTSIHGQVALPYSRSKNISISYATVSFGGKDLTCQFSISKDSDNWRDIRGEEINLVQPGYGLYKIKVRAKTISSRYCEPIVFELLILKPFWAKWWFIALCIMTVVVIASLMIRYRIKYVLRRKEKLHESEIRLLKLEYKALNALMNPHFIFNALNNMQALINKNEKLAANRYLGIFARLIRQNMHNISLELIPLNKEIDIVDDYLRLEKLRFKDLLNYEIRIEETLDISEIMVPPLLIQPLVENSIKHGIFPRKSSDSIVLIHVYERDNFLIIDVKDNGIGIEESQKKADKAHTSFGLDNVRKRLAQLAVIQNRKISLETADIKDDSGKLQWTIVSIRIAL